MNTGQLIQEIATKLSAILTKHGVPVVTDLPQRLTITSDGVNEVTSSRLLSNAILDKVAPPVAGKTVYHFTSEAAAKEIERTQILRLNTLARRFDDQECRALFEALGLPWYLG